MKISRSYVWDNSRTDGHIFKKFDTGKFYHKLASNFNFHLDQTIHEDHILEKNIFIDIIQTNGTHILHPERFLRKT
jgi:hypothetical protein